MTMLAKAVASGNHGSVKTSTPAGAAKVPAREHLPLFAPDLGRIPAYAPPVPMATSQGPLMAKLEVGSVDDPLETEADRVADKVLRMPDPAAAGSTGEPPEDPMSPSGPGLQRKCAACKEEDEEKGVVVQRRAAPDAARGATPAPPIVEQALSGPGRPLDTGTRAYFEPRFGVDLSRIRIHTDARAGESARAVNALAYTVGRDIVFGEGRYAPGAAEGRRLLAHELAHAAQQGSAPARPEARPLAVSAAPPRVSRDAASDVDPVHEKMLNALIAAAKGDAATRTAAIDVFTGASAEQSVKTVARLNRYTDAFSQYFWHSVNADLRQDAIKILTDKVGPNGPVPIAPPAKESPKAAAAPVGQPPPQGQAPAQDTAQIDGSNYAKTTVPSTPTTGGAMLLDKLGGANVLGGATGLPMGTLVRLESSLANGVAFMVSVVDGDHQGKKGVLSRSYLQAAPAPMNSGPSNGQAPDEVSANASVDPSAAAGLAGPVGPQGPVGVVTSGDKQALLTAIRGVRVSDVASGLYTATFEGKTSNISKDQFDAFFAKIAIDIRNAATDVERLATDAQSYYRGQTEVNRRYWLSSEIVALFGNVQDPGPRLLQLVSDAQAHASGARKSLSNLDYEDAAKELAEGETAARLALAMWRTYFNSVQHAGELTISKLETTRKVAGGALLLLAIAASGGAALGVAGLTSTQATAAGYVLTAAALAEQSATVAAKLNDGDEVDWGAVGIDAVFTIVMQFLGGPASGKLLNVVLGKGASVTAKVFAGVLSSVLVGRASTFIHGVVSELWNQHKTAGKSAWGPFWAKVWARVADPEGVIVDILMGAISGIAHHPGGAQALTPGDKGLPKVVAPAEPAPLKAVPPAEAAPPKAVAAAEPVPPAEPAPREVASPVEAASLKPVEAAPPKPIEDAKPVAAAQDVKSSVPGGKPAAPDGPEVTPAAPEPKAAAAQEVKAPAASDDGLSGGGTRGRDVYTTDNVDSKGFGIGPNKLQKVIKKDISEIRTGDGYSAKLNVDTSTKKIEYRYDGKTDNGTVVSGTLIVTDTTGVALGTVEVTVRSTKKFTVGEAHANETGPARIDLVPPDVVNGKPNWQATIEMDMHTRPEDVKFVIGHELDEAAAIVAKKTTDPAQIAAEGQARLTKANATEIDPNSATAHDKAHIKEVDALLADHSEAAGKVKNAEKTIASGSRSVQVTPEMTTAVQDKSVRLQKALEVIGLSDPARVATRRKMLLELGMSEAQVNRLETFVNATHFVRSAPHSGMQATHPAITEATIDHLLHPSTSSDFQASGLGGGHSDANLKAWVKANPEYAINPVKTVGEFTEYMQYEWKGPPPAPTAAADRPGSPTAQIGPTAWSASSKVKTTTTNMQKFLADAEAAWESWRTANYTPSTTPSGTPTGAATADGKKVFTFAMPGGVTIEGVFVYTPSTSGVTPPSWTLVTVYAKL